MASSKLRIQVKKKTKTPCYEPVSKAIESYQKLFLLQNLMIAYIIEALSGEPTSTNRKTFVTITTINLLCHNDWDAFFAK